MSERYRTRRNILSSRDFAEVAERFLALFQEQDIEYALIGGLAVSYYTNPLTTIDADFLIRGTKGDLDAIASEAHPEYTEGSAAFLMTGWRAAPLIFPGRRKGFPRHGLSLRRGSPTPAIVDLLASGDDDFLSGVVENAPVVDVSRGLKLRVARAPDLAVIKFLVGRDKDLEDAAYLMDAMSAPEKAYVYQKVEELE